MRFVLADAYTATDELTGESQLNLLGDAAGTAFGVALETNASLTHLDLTGAPWCHAAWQCQQAVPAGSVQRVGRALRSAV